MLSYALLWIPHLSLVQWPWGCEACWNVSDYSSAHPHLTPYPVTQCWKIWKTHENRDNGGDCRSSQDNTVVVTPLCTICVKTMLLLCHDEVPVLCFCLVVFVLYFNGVCCSDLTYHTVMILDLSCESLAPAAFSSSAVKRQVCPENTLSKSVLFSDTR